MHLTIYAFDNLKFLGIVQCNKVKRTMAAQELNMAGRTDWDFKVIECHGSSKINSAELQKWQTASSDVTKLRWCFLQVSPYQSTGFVFITFLKSSLLFGVQLPPVQTVKCFMPPVCISIIALYWKFNVIFKFSGVR